MHPEGDSKNIVAAINKNASAVKWTTNAIIVDCISSLSSFQSWKCTFVSRKAKNIADLLAKRVYDSASCLFRFDNFSNWLQASTQVDDVV